MEIVPNGSFVSLWICVQSNKITALDERRMKRALDLSLSNARRQTPQQLSWCQ
jgi:hypothetical protein